MTNHTLQTYNVNYLLDTTLERRQPLSLVRRKVVILTLRNSREQLLYRGQALKWRSLPAATKPALVPSVKKRGPLKPPTESHPWRRLGMGVGRKFWKEIKAQGRAALLEVGDSVDLRYRPPSVPHLQQHKHHNNQGDILS